MEASLPDTLDFMFIRENIEIEMKLSKFNEFNHDILTEEEREEVAK